MSKKQKKCNQFDGKMIDSLGTTAKASYEMAMRGGLETAKMMDAEEKEIVFRNLGKAMCLTEEGKEIMFNIIIGAYTVRPDLQDEYDRCANAAKESMESSIGLSMAMLDLAELKNDVEELRHECGHACSGECKKECKKHAVRGPDGRFIKKDKGKKKARAKSTKAKKEKPFSWL